MRLFTKTTMTLIVFMLLSLSATFAAYMAVIKIDNHAQQAVLSTTALAHLQNAEALLLQYSTDKSEKGNSFLHNAVLATRQVLAHITPSQNMLANIPPAVLAPYQSFLQRIEAEKENPTGLHAQLLQAPAPEMHNMRDALENLLTTAQKKQMQARQEGSIFIATLGGGILLVALVCLFVLANAHARCMQQARKLASAIGTKKPAQHNAMPRCPEMPELETALQDTAATLQACLQEHTLLHNTVLQADIHAEANTTLFSGELATLLKNANRMVLYFRSIMEALPCPVVLLNNEMKAMYLNNTARKLVGSDYQNKSCNSLFHRADFGTPQCGLCRAVREHTTTHGATFAQIQGVLVPIEYTSIPLYDEENMLSSILQLITILPPESVKAD